MNKFSQYVVGPARGWGKGGKEWRGRDGRGREGAGGRGRGSADILVVLISFCHLIKRPFKCLQSVCPSLISLPSAHSMSSLIRCHREAQSQQITLQVLQPIRAGMVDLRVDDWAPIRSARLALLYEMNISAV